MSAASSLEGQTALITGAAKRVGAAIARHLHAHGANVVVHYNTSAPPAEQLAAELNRVRANSAALAQGDLLRDDVLPEIIERAARAFGSLHMLINNASTFYPTPVGSITTAHWNDLMGTNLKAPLFLAQAAVPHLRASRGLIINLVDIHAQRPLREHPLYCAAKAGLMMLTRSLARELGPDIRVNGIAPGPILWPEHQMTEELKREIVAKTALKRTGSPQDIAKAVLFFASDAPYVTGQILAVDGGRGL